MVIPTVCNNGKEDTGFVPPSDATIGSEAKPRSRPLLHPRRDKSRVLRVIVTNYGDNCLVPMVDCCRVRDCCASLMVFHSSGV